MSEAHLALMTKLEELDAYTHTVLHQFPKLERHLLCAEMRTAMNKIMRLTVVSLTNNNTGMEPRIEYPQHQTTARRGWIVPRARAPLT